MAEEKKKEATPKIEYSEFEANQFLDLHYVQVQNFYAPCPSNTEGAINLKLKKGDKIPKFFIPTFLMKNRNFLANLSEKDGLPYLSPEQEEMYGVSFRPETPKKPKVMSKYNTEKLMQKWKQLGDKKFKEWAEKTFIEVVGKDVVDKRKSPRNIIYDIRKVLS